jgi:hypothetical protein
MNLHKSKKIVENVIINNKNKSNLWRDIFLIICAYALILLIILVDIKYSVDKKEKLDQITFLSTEYVILISAILIAQVVICYKYNKLVALIIAIVNITIFDNGIDYIRLELNKHWGKNMDNLEINLDTVLSEKEFRNVQDLMNFEELEFNSKCSWLLKLLGIKNLKDKKRIRAIRARYHPDKIKHYNHLNATSHEMNEVSQFINGCL